MKPTWKIFITAPGTHPDEQRIFDLDAAHHAAKHEAEYDVEITADSPRDLAEAHLTYYRLRMLMPPEVVNGTLGEVVWTLPGGREWRGSMQKLLTVINQIGEDQFGKIKRAIAAIEENPVPKNQFSRAVARGRERRERQ